MNNIHGIILAAGKGSRMHSSKPKVLHKIAHLTLLEHVLAQAKQTCQHIHVVYGHGAEQVKKSLDDDKLNWVLQKQQLGTGHAVEQAMPDIDDQSISVILYGDVPLIQKQTLAKLIDESVKTGFALITVKLDNPSGYGRIIRNAENQITAIVEHKDANEEQLKVSEVNTGIMAINTALLKKYLSQLDSNNSQGELYLTDTIEMAVSDGVDVSSVEAENEFEVAGVNDKKQLAELERIMQKNMADKMMAEGLTIKDPNRFDCRGELSFGQDCEVDINVIIEGEVTLGNEVSIGPNCYIKNSTIGEGVQILPNSVIEGALIDDGATIGPFARVRPEAKIGKGAKIGNFVEVKKSTIGAGSKVSHLSYVGDTTMGDNVNIGAGVITCNYDGVNKHQTEIGDDVFVGSDTQLIAPVNVGDGANIGAGSTITKDVPENQLTLSRAKQTTLKNWKRPVKK